MRTQWILAGVLTCGVATLGGQAAEDLQPVSISFSAVVGAEPFGCGKTFDGVGVSRSTIRATDFRFYVSNVRLTRSDGTVVPVALSQDGLWQYEDVALIDFEDATGSCSNGTAQTRSVIEGTVPAGDYAGLTFDLGLPFTRNHLDPTAQPSPLNLTRLFWSWNAGYKFMRLDLRTTGLPQGWVIHLGSTGCDGATATTAPSACRFPNLPTVSVPGFQPERQTLVMDVARLLAGSNVDVNQEKTAVGCMSAQNDADCGPVFSSLGLPFGETAATGQRVFAARARQ